MQPIIPLEDTTSPFHIGERAIQKHAGKHEPLQKFGHLAIRPFMPDQHRSFFGQLPFVVMGSVDADGWPWASMIAGTPGFMASPDRTRLDISAAPADDDPLATSLHPGAQVGILGIEIPTRRRNRVNMRVNAVTPDGISLDVDQSFGNCPQYIQTRDIRFVRDPKALVDRAATDRFTALDDAARQFIAAADTFFVSSHAPRGDSPVKQGVDVSHRGGRAGFVKVEGNTLTIPDYSGNHFFNTLGNFLLNPKAGLIFPDFETGDLLMLTGRVEILWEDHPEIMAFHGAERGWRFTLDHGLRIHDALPFRARFGAWSPNSLMADDWTAATARMAAEAQRNKWRPFRITDTVNESSNIRSFVLVPMDGTPILRFKAGQFLAVRATPDGQEAPLIRTYTVSSAPGDAGYRISVKREPDGVFSRHLHDTVRSGDVIMARAPRGAFHLDPAQQRPAVLLAGGVGITPMIAMAQHAMAEGRRTRRIRPLTIVHAARTIEQRAFAPAFRSLAQESEGVIRYFSLISNPTKQDRRAADFDATGHITADTLRQILPLDDYDFYLCGPAAFMQSVHDILRQLGVPDGRIQAESFGPAALIRSPDADVASAAPTNEADTTVVKFTASGFEQRWSKGDPTLLETAEAHGLSPAFSCRTGKCGSCATALKSGAVVYRSPPAADVPGGEVLVCCAVPAHGTEVLELDL